MSAIRLIPRQRPRLGAPKLIVENEYEGLVTACIRGGGDAAGAEHMRAWLESDPDRRAICELARRLRDRLGAA